MAGTAPFYDNIRWGGPQGGRIPQELFPATFLVQQEGTGGIPALSPVTVTVAAAAQPAYRIIDAELVLGYQGSTTVSGSVAPLRGNTTIAAGTTITGASYVYGAQGKLTIKGTHSGSAEVSTGILGQLDLSACTGMTAPLACIWGDCGASVGTVTGADIDIAVLYNTTSATINSMVRGYAKASVCFDLSSNGSACLDASSTAAGSVIGHILVKMNGTAGVIRVYNGS